MTKLIVSFCNFAKRDKEENYRHRNNTTKINNFMFFCTVHCNIIIQYKATKCTCYKLIFKFLNFLCLLHFSNQRVHLEEDSCIYRYGILCFTCISISNHVGRRVCMNTLFYLQMQSCRLKNVYEHTLLPTVAVL